MPNFNFNASFFTAFPEMRRVVKSKFDYFGEEEPGSYLIFEMVLVPAIQEAGSMNPARLKNLMDFVEKVAVSDRNIVKVCLGEVLRTLPNERQIFEAAGPITKRVIC